MMENELYLNAITESLLIIFKKLEHYDNNMILLLSGKFILLIRRHLAKYS